jgi:hypothetical protein
MLGRVLSLVVLLVSLVSSNSFGNEKWRRVVALEGHWRFSIGDNKKWATPGYNDADWETIHVPSKWEDQGFNGFNGYAWYRKSFDGTALRNSNLAYHLFLGYIDDVDEVYLNGHLIGASGSFPPKYHTAFNAERRYVLPSEYINFKGANVISVRVFDAEIEGGIVSGNIGIYVNDNDAALAINLRGIWDFSIAEKKGFGMTEDAAAFRIKRTPPEKASWGKLMVPGLWEHQGYDRFDGTVWYRKQFVLPKSLEGEDLVLILGKIDDYDQAYLNGKLIGTTTNYDHLRIYHVSSDMFQAGAYNLLMIYVYDFGGLGGIYEGPVGFMKQTDFTRFMRYRD